MKPSIVKAVTLATICGKDHLWSNFLDGGQHRDYAPLNRVWLHSSIAISYSSRAAERDAHHMRNGVIYGRVA